jgi:hypothetical protein
MTHVIVLSITIARGLAIYGFLIWACLAALIFIIASLSWLCRQIRIWTYRHLTNRTTKSTGRI